MGDYCSFCDYEPDRDSEMLNINDRFSLCPDCAEKYGYIRCEHCYECYPVWSGTVAQKENGRYLCKFCAEQFRIPAKVVHRNKADYLMLPKLSPKLYPFLILSVIQGDFGLTKTQIRKELDFILCNRTRSHEYRNGVDHKTVTANLELLMHPDNPYSHLIAHKGRKYYDNKR